MSAAGVEPKVPPAQAALWHAEWLVTVGPRGRADGDLAGRRWQSGDTELSVVGGEGSDLRIAEDARLVVILSGVLSNAREIDPTAGAADAAQIALRMIAAESDAAFTHLRGAFALLVWHRDSATLQVVRDQVGLQPIFWAQGQAGWVLSPSPDVLVSQPGVSRAFDAVALSEWLCGWFPAMEDTAYREVKRVPPATVMTLRGASSSFRRYWDPFPQDGELQYLGDDEIEQFEPTLTRAVRRAMDVGPSAIFLSGGLDSIAVAVAATDVARERAAQLPLALSLVFPEGASNEEAVQAGAARLLGLAQQLVPFDEAVGPPGLLAGALALSATWPQPMWNLWAPAYMALARRAAADGRRLLLTGRGGDEWLTLSPYLLADLLRRGDLTGAWRLLQMRRRSNNLRGVRAAARLLWLTAGRPLASAALDRVAPAMWHRRRRQRLLAERPDWVAPDPVVRRAMDERIERWIEPARPSGGFYQREARLALRHPAIAHDMEETQEFGRRHGMRMLHPFWDVDVIELAHRVPPEVLMQDGRSKWLLRRRLTARLAGLGLERRGKVSARGVFQDLLEHEAPPILEKLGGPQALARIGVVATSGIESAGQPPSLTKRWGGSGRLWTLLNLETWVRQRAKAQ